MAVWDKLFTGFAKAAKAAKGATKGASKAAKTTAKSNIILKGAVKPKAVNTATNMYTKSDGSSYLKNYAKSIVNSPVVKTTSKIGTGAIVIGGSTYALGKLSRKGLSDLGYGLRGLTNNYTSQEQTAQDLDNAQDALDLEQDKIDQLKDFYSWAKDNGYNDSPSIREAYDEYVQGASGLNSEKEQSNSWMIIAGLAAAGAGVYFLTKKKKKVAK